MGREAAGVLAFEEAALSTLRGILHCRARVEEVRLVEEEPERFGLLVREVPGWVESLEKAFGALDDLVVEDRV